MLMTLPTRVVWVIRGMRGGGAIASPYSVLLYWGIEIRAVRLVPLPKTVPYNYPSPGDGKERPLQTNIYCNVVAAHRRRYRLRLYGPRGIPLSTGNYDTYSYGRG